MSSIKKKQEEKSLKILRDLLTYESNRFCFDCNQRGPTYVNMTIGSFVCTNCGGALRKYNHRVKSISMSNFSPSEMEFIKKRGNNICKKIYYGLCENYVPSEFDIKDGMLDSHLRAKYELKKWYVEPTPEMEEETIQANQIIFDRVEKGIPKPTRTYTPNSSSKIIIEPPKQTSAKVTLAKVNSKSSIDNMEAISSTVTIPTKSSNGALDIEAKVDPSKLGGGSSVKLPLPNDTKNAAWFASNDHVAQKTVSSPFDDDFFASETAINNGPITKSQTMNFNMAPLVPMQPLASGQSVSSNVPTKDKYAALAELDDLFSNVNLNKQQQQIGSSAFSSGWEANQPTWTGTNHFAVSQPVGQPISNPFSQPMTYSQPPVQSFNPFSSAAASAAPQPQHSLAYNWPGSSSMAPASPPVNPFFSAAVVNPTTVKSNNPFL